MSKQVHSMEIEWTTLVVYGFLVGFGAAVMILLYPM